MSGYWEFGCQNLYIFNFGNTPCCVSTVHQLEVNHIKSYISALYSVKYVNHNHVIYVHVHSL